MWAVARCWAERDLSSVQPAIRRAAAATAVRNLSRMIDHWMNRTNGSLLTFLLGAFLASHASLYGQQGTKSGYIFGSELELGVFRPRLSTEIRLDSTDGEIGTGVNYYSLSVKAEKMLFTGQTNYDYWGPSLFVRYLF